MNWNRSLPTGTKDKLFREAKNAFHLEQAVADFFEKRGYLRIETPMIEFEDVFAALNQAEAKHYRFFDEKGRLLVLRPDLTLPISRVVSTTGVTLPLKLSYSGKIFRANESHGGDKNEETQAGIELIGYDSQKAELECILAGMQLIQELAIPHFQLELGHAAIYQAIIRELRLSENAEREFRQHLQNKNLSGLKNFAENFPSELAAFITQLPRLFGPVEETLASAKQLTQNPQILFALEEIETTARLVQQIEPAANLTVDIGLVQELDYYSGLIFRGFADYAADYFLSGGRYDQFPQYASSERIPAVGLALHLDTILTLLEKTRPKSPPQAPKILIHYELSELKEALRYAANKPNSSLSFFDSPRESIAFARKWDFDQVIAFTPENVSYLYEKELEA
ncbi:ATP phosphoribosyltransferase regulatory subunit [Listeria costaricensis]|uniref:ATP phosphoribosyltransferase regulatory subunit n=1 Tax=Listeria costaricensis TaxID=2026604 RepID=UPI000C078F98|nr:ATP phosphoribosyltransferase regulatory subunit [Listeria costaricensis]